MAEIRRIHSRLGTLTEEQLAAVEALTRGLVNKFLHPPMQALKQAARQGDSARLEALCEEWSVSSAPAAEAQRETPQAAAGPAEAKNDAWSVAEPQTSALNSDVEEPKSA